MVFTCSSPVITSRKKRKQLRKTHWPRLSCARCRVEFSMEDLAHFAASFGYFKLLDSDDLHLDSLLESLEFSKTKNWAFRITKKQQNDSVFFFRARKLHPQSLMTGFTVVTPIQMWDTQLLYLCTAWLVTTMTVLLVSHLLQLYLNSQRESRRIF